MRKRKIVIVIVKVKYDNIWPIVNVHSCNQVVLLLATNSLKILPCMITRPPLMYVIPFFKVCFTEYYHIITDHSNILHYSIKSALKIFDVHSDIL